LREYDINTTNYINARDGIAARYLAWFEAKNRSTGATETMGLWTGDDLAAFTIDGQVRAYYGAGAMLGIEPLRAGVGLDVRMHQIVLAPITAEVAQLIRGYDTRLTPVQIHRALLNLETGALVATPFRVFSGWVNTIALRTGAIDGQSEAVVTIASASRGLTRPLNLFRSDAAMRERNASDTFRAYADISGDVGVWWGERRSEDMRGQR